MRFISLLCALCFLYINIWYQLVSSYPLYSNSSVLNLADPGAILSLEEFQHSLSKDVMYSSLSSLARLEILVRSTAESVLSDTILSEPSNPSNSLANVLESIESGSISSTFDYLTELAKNITQESILSPGESKKERQIAKSGVKSAKEVSRALFFLCTG